MGFQIRTTSTDGLVHCCSGEQELLSDEIPEVSDDIPSSGEE